MSKKTTLLIIFLFLVTCGLLYLALVSTPYKKPTVTSPTPTPMSVNAHTTLDIAAASASQSSQTAQYTLAVNIQTNGNPVNSVQLELAYDPTALTNVVVKPGMFFTQPNELVNNIDTADGRISYATTQQLDLPGATGSGTIAFISFDKQPSFTQATTTLTFLPKTAVSADKILESVLKQTTNYTLTIVKPYTSPTSNQTSSTPSAY